MPHCKGIYGFLEFRFGALTLLGIYMYVLGQEEAYLTGVTIKSENQWQEPTVLMF